MKTESSAEREKKYFSLYMRIRDDIENGKYGKNTKLPSKRAMSAEYGCSVITVQKAYGMLSDEGYITSEMRRGYFVTDLGIPAGAGGQKRSPSVSRLKEPPPCGDCGAEYSAWFRTVRKVISGNDGRLFLKAPGMGCEVLRNAISDYLARCRGMNADPACMLIGSGSEQLYETAVKILGRGPVYGIEDPCFRQISAVYEGMGVKICRLSMGSDGIEDKDLREKRFDILHVTPFHSYPSGITTSAAKKYSYLKWAAENGSGYIIEDDFDSEFAPPGSPVQTLYSMDTSDRVIYINTFSKSLSPAMRIGYMILPPALLEKFGRRLGFMSCSVPVMDQYILAEFISSGSFERHLSRARRKAAREDR